jgi:drug/metabolite transporter (DMT)-like permease
VDCLGNLAYASATARGAVSVVSLLAATYPVVTVSLARLRLGEPVPRVRVAGILTAVVGAALVGTAA